LVTVAAPQPGIELLERRSGHFVVVVARLSLPATIVAGRLPTFQW
jgi:hypothetical protein